MTTTRTTSHDEVLW